jgi:excisionase family DNA binding protein
MDSLDVYKLFGDLNAKQERILALLNDLFHVHAQPKIYDLIELQEILHVSKRTVASWLKQGSLPHSRLGGKIWVTESQLQAFLDQNSNEPDTNRRLSKMGGVNHA